MQLWQCVTGSLDPGETPMQAAQRELAEETGLGAEGILIDKNRSRLFSIDPRWIDRYAPGTTENIEHEMHYRLANTSDIRIEDSEHDMHRWAPIDEAIDTVWSWTNKEALQELKTQLQQNILKV